MWKFVASVLLIAVLGQLQVEGQFINYTGNIWYSCIKVVHKQAAAVLTILHYHQAAQSRDKCTRSVAPPALQRVPTLTPSAKGNVFQAASAPKEQSWT